MIFVSAKHTKERIPHTLDRKLLTCVFIGIQMEHLNRALVCWRIKTGFSPVRKFFAAGALKQTKFSFLPERVVLAMTNTPSESVKDPEGKLSGVRCPGCAMILAGRVCTAPDYFHILKNIRPQLGIPCRVTDNQPHFHYKQGYHTVSPTAVISLR